MPHKSYGSTYNDGYKQEDPFDRPTMTPVQPDPCKGAMLPAHKDVDWTEVVVWESGMYIT